MDDMTPLKQAIVDKGLRQKWLAEQLGITEDALSRWVTGQGEPGAEIAQRLAKLLGKPLKELYPTKKGSEGESS